MCFADSGHAPDGFSLTREQVESALDAFIRAEGDPEVVMFSGGDPTIHPQILEFLQLAGDKGIGLVTLNTNGTRLAHDRRFVATLAGVDPRPRIYLQFDGLEERTHREIRGRDLRAAKQRALDHCAEFGLQVILVAAIERGLNEHEIGLVVRFGMHHPAVKGVAFQPVTHSGRHVTFDPTDRVTNADVIHALADQLPEWFRISDFVPVPCCFPTCRRIIPFCAYNSAGYREQVREQLSGTAVPTIVPNSTELQPVLITTLRFQDRRRRPRRRQRRPPRRRHQHREGPMMNRPEASRPTDPETLKACCAAAYEQDLVALLLGESYHPGGLDVTRHLARALQRRPGQRVLDVAAGPGATACLLAAEFGADVDGLDLRSAPSTSRWSRLRRVLIL